MQLKLYLLGTPRLEYEGELIDLALRKGMALLAYLSVTRQAHSRDHLATLLWPDKSQTVARANLRRTLYELSHLLPVPLWEGSGEQVRLAPEVVWLDVEQFDAYVQEALPSAAPVAIEGRQPASDSLAGLAEAAALYRADFMDGFTLPDSPEYDDWQYFTREEWRRRLIEVLDNLIAGYQARAQWSEALRYAQRRLMMDSLDEESQRQLMRLYAQTGQVGAALRQYEACVRLLADELSAPPEEETTALYEAIRTRRFPPPASDPPAAPTSPPAMPAAVVPRPTAALPVQTTPFVGRRQELAELLRRVCDPNCRLLTLVGPGGIGKTRLALAAAQSLLDHMKDAAPFGGGVFFVALQPVDTPSRLVPAIAEAIGLHFYGSEPPQEQLLRHLHDKHLLLILDNFEHLLAGADFVFDMMAAAPHVTLLVTSREALKLQEEWFHPVAGMSLPPVSPPHPPKDAAPLPPDFAASDAVSLFVQTAHRAQVAFDPASQQEAIARICRLVDGLPLAIELAASWLKLLTCAQIADEIAHGVDILVARHQNVPSRHRSMRAVLEQSWQLIDTHAQAVLQRLSVFRGGFLPDAATVAEADLLTLAELMDRAWIYRTPDGRYQIHELLRQYAASKLAESPAVQVDAQDRHAEFYLCQIAQREADLLGPGQRSALDTIAAELDNGAAAWSWAVEQRAWTLLGSALHALYLFFYTRSRYVEGEELMVQALNQLDRVADESEEIESLRVRLQARRGAFKLHRGHLEEAERYLVAVSDASRDPRERAFASTNLGAVHRLRGNRHAGEAVLQQSLAWAQASGDLNQMAEALHMLSDIVASFADFAEGKRLAQEALAICRQLERPDLTAHVAASLAWACNCLGEYAESERYYRECLEISTSIDNPFGIALATNFLGWVAFCEGGERLAEAAALYDQALTIWRHIGQPTNIAMCLGDSALTAYEQGDYEQAQRFAQEGLEVAKQIQHPDLTSYNLYGLAAASCGLGDFVTSRRYLMQSMQIAHESRIPDNAAATIYIWTQLLVREGQSDELEPDVRTQKWVQALELLTLIIEHRATWQLFRDRARRVQADLLERLPSEVAAAALARGRQRPFDEVVAALAGAMET